MSDNEFGGMFAAQDVFRDFLRLSSFLKFSEANIASQRMTICRSQKVSLPKRLSLNHCLCTIHLPDMGITEPPGSKAPPGLLA